MQNGVGAEDGWGGIRSPATDMGVTPHWGDASFVPRNLSRRNGNCWRFSLLLVETLVKSNRIVVIN